MEAETVKERGVPPTSPASIEGNTVSTILPASYWKRLSDVLEDPMDYDMDYRIREFERL